jgi:DNA-binding HxlR family transcriptional regulator
LAQLPSPPSSPRVTLWRDCTPSPQLALLGKRWNGLLLGSLSDGPSGFRQLSRTIGAISDSVLSDPLAELTRAGLVTRHVEEGPPVTVTYELTGSGRALIPALEQIAERAQQYLPADPD